MKTARRLQAGRSARFQNGVPTDGREEPNRLGQTMSVKSMINTIARTLQRPRSSYFDDTSRIEDIAVVGMSDFTADPKDVEDVRRTAGSRLARYNMAKMFLVYVEEVVKGSGTNFEKMDAIRKVVVVFTTFMNLPHPSYLRFLGDPDFKFKFLGSFKLRLRELLWLDIMGKAELPEDKSEIHERKFDLQWRQFSKAGVPAPPLVDEEEEEGEEEEGEEEEATEHIVEEARKLDPPPTVALGDCMKIFHEFFSGLDGDPDGMKLIAETLVAEMLEDASEDMKQDRDFVMMVVQQSGLALEFAHEDLKRDFDIVMAAVKQNGYALRHAHESMKNNREIALAAVEQDYSALQYAPEDLEIAMAAVKQCWRALGYAGEGARRDFDIVMAAVQQSGYALAFAHESMRCNREIAIAAVQQDTGALRCVDEDVALDLWPEIARDS